MRSIAINQVEKLLEKSRASIDPIEAYRIAIEAENQALKSRDSYQIAACEIQLSQILAKSGAYGQALIRNMRALEFFNHSTDQLKIAGCWRNMAIIYGRLGDYDKQLMYNEKCLEIYTFLDLPLERLRIQNNIGYSYLNQGNLEIAIQIFDQNLQNQHLNLELHCTSLKNLGIAVFRNGKHEAAEILFLETINIGTGKVSEGSIIASHFMLGCIYQNQQLFYKAYFHLKKSYDGMDESGGLILEHLEIVEQLTKVSLSLKKLDEAKIYLDAYVKKSAKLNAELNSKAIKVNQFKIEISEIEIERTQLKEQNDQLQKANQKIENQKQQLIAANEELKSFAHTVSHDLKQPIRNVTNFAKLLENEITENATPNSIQYLDIIKNCSEEMSKFVDGVLKYSEAGNTDIEVDQVDCNKILKQVIYGLRTQLDEANGKVVYNNLPTIHAHSTLIFQIFQNLISNAIKFSKKGIPPVVQIQTSRKEDLLVFSIQDNGIGIRDEHKEKVFNIFSRLNNKSEYEGSGIGLSTVLKILKRYKAQISFTSQFGEGTTFYLSFPIEMCQ